MISALKSRGFGFGFRNFTNEELKCVTKYRKIKSNNTHADPDVAEKIFASAKNKDLDDHWFIFIFSMGLQNVGTGLTNILLFNWKTAYI